MAEQIVESISIQHTAFSDTLEAFISKYAKVLCIFSGSIDKDTKKSWCSDCVAAHPLIQEYVIPTAKEKNIPVIQCNVGEKEEWKSQKHPLRLNPKVHLKCIPSIIEITKAGIQKKIEEEDCQQKPLLQMLFK